MYWLLYDICSQRRRLKVVQLCKDHGLRRIQKSCFFGIMDSADMKGFEKEMAELVEEEDSVCMIPVNQSMMERVKLWGKGETELKFEEEELYFL